MREFMTCSASFTLKRRVQGDFKYVSAKEGGIDTFVTNTTGHGKMLCLCMHCLNAALVRAQGGVGRLCAGWEVVRAWKGGADIGGER